MDFVVDTTFVDTTLPAHIVIGATGLAGLAQEVRTLLATRKGSVPLDRDFGVDWSFVDAPVTDAMPRVVAEYARQIERYIPRVQVRSITFSPAVDKALEGRLCPVVNLSIRKEYLNDFR